MTKAKELIRMGRLITNSLINSDFSNGTTGWSSNLATLSIDNGAMSMLPSAANGQATSNAFANVTGNKLYIRYKYKISSSLVLMTVAGISGSGSPAMIADNAWHNMSYIWQCTLAGNYALRLRDSNASGWTQSYLDDVLVIDLTVTFGAGNEPDAATMANLLLRFPNSWFKDVAYL